MTVQESTLQSDSEVEAAVTFLQQAGLAGPAYLLLRGFRPVASLGGHGLLFLQPMLPLERWRRGAERFAGLLTDGSRLDALLTSLEERLREPGNAEQEERTP